MKVSDYIANFLVRKGITHIWGYQGTMIAHLVDSIGKNPFIENHSVYNEQAAAFAACGYAKASGKCAAAYATSGPGAMNLLSGVADAYYDSVPVLFITGQINTNEYTGVPELRQQAFQEANVVEIMRPVTKYAVFVESADQIAGELEKAWEIANSGRKGPVLLDIPMNVQRMDIELKENSTEMKSTLKQGETDIADKIIAYIEQAKRPLLILGNGINKDSESRIKVKKLVEQWKIPVISSLLGSDILEENNPCYFGTIGAAYGHRYANLIAYEKCDLIISLGSSLCRRQTGIQSEKFAEKAQIIRVDIDPVELKRKVHEDEIQFNTDANVLVEELLSRTLHGNYSEWLAICKNIKEKLSDFDNCCEERQPNKFIRAISECIEDAIVCCDVGQHMMWAMQSIGGKNNRILYSGGHGAMGFALPAAMGAYYSVEGKNLVVCIAGDGSFQMNIQELQTIVRENLSICMIVLNNNSLGLIRQQQDDFFDKAHYGATKECGFSSPRFCEIAQAYGIHSYKIHSAAELKECLQQKMEGPKFVEVILPEDTKAVPKTYFGQKMINQKPYIPEELFKKLMNV